MPTEESSSIYYIFAWGCHAFQKGEYYGGRIVNNCE